MTTLNEHFANRPRVRQPYPDPVASARLRERTVPSAPLDFHIRGEGVAATTARDALTALLGTWGTVGDLARNPETDLKTLASKGQAALDRNLKVADRAAATVRSVIAATDKTIKEKTEPVMSEQIATEMRALVRSDPNRAFDLARSDARFAGAILKAPAALSGLTQQQFDQVRDLAEQTHAAEDTAARREARAALGVLEAAGSRAVATLGTRLADWRTKAPNLGALDES